MLFTNVTPYKFSKELIIDDRELESQLNENLIGKIGENDAYLYGWDKYHRSADSLFLKIGGCYLLKLVKLEKVIPTSAINKELSDRIEDIEKEQGYKVGRKHKQELKEQIFLERLPTAMVVEKPTYLYIDTLNKSLIVNTASTTSSDDATSFLRKTIGSLPIVPMVSESSPALKMTNWLNGLDSAPQGFQILQSAKLKNSEGVSISFSDFEIDQYISDLASQGMECKELRMNFNGELSFTLTSDLKLKSIKWEIDDGCEYEDALDALNSTFYLNAQKLNSLLCALM